MPLEKILVKKVCNTGGDKATAHITLDFWLDPEIQVVFRKHGLCAGAYESPPLHSHNLKIVSCAKLEGGSNFYQHQIAPGPFCSAICDLHTTLCSY